MKTKDELDAIKEEIDALNEKLAVLTEEELEQVVGGSGKAPVLKAGKALKDAIR